MGLCACIAYSTCNLISLLLSGFPSAFTNTTGNSEFRYTIDKLSEGEHPKDDIFLRVSGGEDISMQGSHKITQNFADPFNDVPEPILSPKS